MLFGSNEFKIMEQSAQALWMKQKVISQNIANYDTPDYKAKTLNFSEVLQSEQNKGSDRVIDISVTTDDTTSVRPDGNNVDMVKENLEMYKTYMQSSYLFEKINGQFTSINNVMSQMPK